MNIFEKIKRTVAGLDSRDFRVYLTGTIALTAITIGGISFKQYRTMKQLKRKIARLNHDRETVQRILTRFEKVKQQKAEVSTLLEENPNFLLLGYLNTLLETLQLTQQTAGLTQSEEALENLPEYSEVKFDVHLVGVNMKQVVSFLDKIEQSERVYTKNIEIVRQDKTETLDVHLTVGTLQTKLME